MIKLTKLNKTVCPKCGYKEVKILSCGTILCQGIHCLSINIVDKDLQKQVESQLIVEEIVE